MNASSGTVMMFHDEHFSYSHVESQEKNRKGEKKMFLGAIFGTEMSVVRETIAQIASESFEILCKVT